MRKTFIRVIVGICLSAAGVVVALVTIVFITSIPHPSDRQMIKEFARNQRNFNQLLSMIEEEPHVTRVGKDFVWVDGERTIEENDPERTRYLTNARWRQYQTLIQELHIVDVGRSDDGSASFGRSSWGLAIGGWEKGFYWSRAPVAHPLARNSRETVDQACNGHSEGCYNYKQLAPNWFIEFERN